STYSRWALIATAGLLGACVSSVVVDAQFPTPLVQPLPVRMGVLLDEELQNFVHVEALPQQSAWTIDLGDANLALLSPLFERMFAETRTVDQVPVAPSLYTRDAARAGESRSTRRGAVGVDRLRKGGFKTQRYSGRLDHGG